MPCVSYYYEEELKHDRKSLDDELRELLDEVNKLTNNQYAIRPYKTQTGFFRKVDVTRYILLSHVDGMEYQIMNFGDEKGEHFNHFQRRPTVSAYLFGVLNGLKLLSPEKQKELEIEKNEKDN